MLPRLRARLAARLRGRGLPWQVGVLAMLLTAPALGGGWQLDDHFQRLAMRGGAADVQPHEIFSVLNGDPARQARFLDLGLLPWWTGHPFQLAFLRPLAVATHWLDYRCWPDAAWLMHLHSLLWLGAAVAAAALVYRRLIRGSDGSGGGSASGGGRRGGGSAEAGLAALLYALEGSHAMPAGWLANRNALLATCFGFLALAAHDRWRRDAWRPGAWLGAFCLGLALLSGEMGVSACAYLAAYALLLDPAGRRRGVLAVVPSGAVFLAWAVAYRLLGYGARGSAFYIDPLASPAAALRAAVQRAPLLLLGQWSPLPADAAALLSPAGAQALWLVSLGFLALLFLLLWPLLRRDVLSRFWAAGMALSLVPIVATQASNRLLFFTGLGAMGLLARLIKAAFFGGPVAAGAADGRVEAGAFGGGGVRAAVRIAVGALAVVHLVLAPLSAPFLSTAAAHLGAGVPGVVASVPHDAAISGQDLVIVDAPDFLVFAQPIVVLNRLAALPVPRRLRVLTAAPVALGVSRLDAHSLRVDVHGDLFQGSLASLFRSADAPLRTGEKIELPGLTVEVAALAGESSAGAADRASGRLVFRFAVPLDDPSLRWLRWDGGRFVAFVPPPAGVTVELPAPRGIFAPPRGRR